MTRRLTALALLCPVALLIAACGEDDWKAADPSSADASQAAKTVADSDGAASSGKKEKKRTIKLARCPDGLTNCAAAAGRVIFIESVDPDGDGDLHVVATRTKGEAVTGAGLVVFDVRKEIRPKKDPQAGDLVTGAGPVYKGSYGQSQIQVLEFRIKRSR